MSDPMADWQAGLAGFLQAAGASEEAAASAVAGVQAELDSYTAE